MMWWVATIATLVVIDDLTYGPVFWVLSSIGPTGVVVGSAFLLYWIGQVFIVREATKDHPHRLADFFLTRLQLARKSPEVGRREQSIQRVVTGSAIALPMSLLIGGVLPPLLLYRSGHDRLYVRRLSLATSAVYAAEFAYLHGYLPSVVI